MNHTINFFPLTTLLTVEIYLFIIGFSLKYSKDTYQHSQFGYEHFFIVIHIFDKVIHNLAFGVGGIDSWTGARGNLFRQM